MADTSSLAALVAGGGFALAFLFGWIAHRTHFCTMGAVSDVMNMGDWLRMRMWMLAMAVAIVFAQALHWTGQVDLSKSLYAGTRLIWLSHIVGGFAFGIGMTIASGCGARNLVRLGAGNLKSLVVVMCLGMAAYMTMKGVLAPLRVYGLESVALQLSSGQMLPELLALTFGTGAMTTGVLVTSVITLGLLWFVFKDSEFRRRREALLGGVGVGLLVALGWYLTGHVGYLAEDPETLMEAYIGSNTRRPESFTFVGPVAYALELLLLWTDASLGVTFGIAAVVGVVAGSGAHAAVSREFRWEGFTSVQDLRRHMLGGLLMGFGGVCALGCTIGQGITGLSTLALGAFLTLAALIAGSALTMKWLYWRMDRAAA